MSRPRICAIDERGWRVPQEGTKSRSIYELVLLGQGTAEISERLRMSPNSVAVLTWRIKHPDEDRRRSNRAGGHEGEALMQLEGSEA